MSKIVNKSYYDNVADEFVERYEVVYEDYIEDSHNFEMAVALIKAGITPEKFEGLKNIIKKNEAP